MTGPARLTGRSTRVPVFTFRAEPGDPPVWAMRIDREAVARVDAHSHVHDFPGIVFFEADGGALRAGDSFLIRPGELVDLGDTDALVAARGWGLYFTPEALVSSGPEADNRLAWHAHPLLRPFVAYDDRESLRFRVPPADRPAWSAGMAAIESEMRARHPGYREAAVGHLTVLLVAAARLVAGRAAAVLGEGDLVDQVLDIIERRYADPITLADVSAAVHLSPGHLTTTVRERTGRTVPDWIAERRLTEARRLLLETDLPVGDIGRRVGYPDPGYFARVFRRAHGVTPRSWRAAH